MPRVALYVVGGILGGLATAILVIYLALRHVAKAFRC